MIQFSPGTQPSPFTGRRGAFLRRILPVFVLAGLSIPALATPEQGQAAINAQLANFASQALKPATKAKNTLTASASDLITAVCSVLLDPANTLSAADIAAGALLQSGGQVRPDRNALASRIVDGAIRASDPGDATSVAAIAKAVAGVNDDGNNGVTGPNELKIAGKAAAIAAALKLATAPNSGGVIAQQSLPLILNGDEATLQKFAKKALKGVGTNAEQVRSFVDGLFDNGGVPNTNRTTFSTILARSVISNRAAAGEVIGSIVVDTPPGPSHDTVILNAALTALDAGVSTSLLPAAAEIVAATASQLDGTISPSSFATRLAGAPNVSAATKGLIAGGAIQAASDASTLAIISGVLGAAGHPVVDMAKFAGAAATHNGGGTDTKLEKIAGALGKDAPLGVKKAIGQEMIRTIGKSDPASAARVYNGLVNIAGDSDPVVASDTKRIEFGIAITKTVPTSNAAIGAVAKAVAGPASDDVLVAEIFIKNYQTTAVGVAQRVSELAADKAQFAKDLTGRNPANASAVAVGVSITDPVHAENIVFATATFNRSTKARVAAIAGAVARVVNIEKAADIGTKLATNLGTGGLKLSQAPAIAAAIAKSIQKNPGVPTSNRADELGELAASIVGGVLGKSATPLAEAALVSSIGKQILKALSLKSKPNNLNLKADLREAADVAGSIAQTISLNPFLTPGQKTVLLDVNGKLARKLSAFVGVKYAASVHAAIREVRAAGIGNVVAGSEPIGSGGILPSQTSRVGKYEIGSVNDPETPKKNL